MRLVSPEIGRLFFQVKLGAAAVIVPSGRAKRMRLDGPVATEWLGKNGVGVVFGEDGTAMVGMQQGCGGVLKQGKKEVL